MLKKSLPPIIVGLLTFALVQIISTGTSFLAGLERSFLNAFYYIREPGVYEINPFVSERVRLLGYDEDSIAVIGKWPWKRYVHAEFLDKIEEFSPETVMFDIIFAKPESVPPYIVERLDLTSRARHQIEKAFVEMDEKFAKTLAKYDNVFLDLQLMEQPRPGLPEFFKKRIEFNEQIITGYSLPTEDNESLFLFHSLEPILNNFLKNSHPVVINVLPEDDGIVRFFPLYYTYQMNDGSLRNIFTVALTMIKQYYRVENKDIIIKPDKVVLKSARVPVSHRDTRQAKLFTFDLDDVTARISNLEPPKGYHYNENLFNLMVNQILIGFHGKEKIPYFPLHALKKKDNSLEILDSWEVYRAAAQVHSEKIDVVLYEEKDVEIETPLGNFFYINFSGKEKRYYPDPDTGLVRSHTPIPTGSYKDIYTLADFPDLPRLNSSGTISHKYDKMALERWFFGFCKKKYEEINQQAQTDLRHGAQDSRKVLEYMNLYPESGKYFFFHRFFAEINARPGMFATLVEKYPSFGRQMGQDTGYFLSEKQMLLSLMSFYREQFDKYYNKFIFTGTNAIGLGDVQQTPYASMFGVNVIINAFNTIITENPLKKSTDIPYLDFFLLLSLCMIFSLLYGLINIRISSIIFAALFLSTFIISLFLFYDYSFFLKTTPLLLSNIIIFVGIMIFKLMTEEKDRKFLKATFASYLSPELIDEMHKTKTMPELGGEAKSITAFFTDIQGFSTFSEKLTAEQLVELLNEYLSAMTDIIIAEKGTLDKYEGDAILAFFGAPIDLPDHALRAVNVGVAMQNRLLALCEKWSDEKQSPDKPSRNTKNLPPEEWAPGDKWPKVVHRMKMRIGINTGEIVVGNMGSSMRMNYTMMGDSVNLAARLEEAGKQYGVYTMVSEYTLEQEFIDEYNREKKVSDVVKTRFIDKITVVGKSEPVKVYEVIATDGVLTNQDEKLLGLFDKGMQYYIKMEWDNAIKLFTKSLEIERITDGATTPSETYIRRCREFKKNPPVPPGQKWDGVFRLTEK